AVLGTGEVPGIVGAIGGATAPLTFLRGGESRIATPESRRERPTYLYDATTPTSRSPKAAITSARSASSRRCAAAIGAVRARRWSARRGRWRPAASRN